MNIIAESRIQRYQRQRKRANHELTYETACEYTESMFIQQQQIYKTQTWVAVEIPFQSTVHYSRPFYDAQLDVLFTAPDGRELQMPGFWDGGDTWLVRFAPVCDGIWTFRSGCSDPQNRGLHGVEGTIIVTAYAGELAIYRHGFLKTKPGCRYLMYDDETPFFYIGDTHWSMCAEPFEEMFYPLIHQRAAQGFTVYQSEPIGAKYRLTEGLTQKEILGFQDMDQRFRVIAQAGLVHANAQLFFTSELQENMFSNQYSDEDLQQLSRYWVARYAAYPVLWTTAQEADDDFHEKLDVHHNRWKIIFKAIHQYDPYGHPQSAHQEGDHKTAASNSQFKDLDGYAWFAAQTHTNKSGMSGQKSFKDFWDNSGQRPVIAYESHYENLWTNDFGVRQQGWIFLLSGMCGHGYGAQDIWLYDSAYDKDKDTVIGNITITKEMKNVTWHTSRYYAAADELAGYMKDFFQSIEWWKLIARFDDTAWFEPSGSYYAIATLDHDLYVVYFYNQTLDTGKLKGLADVVYQAQWFNPRTNEYRQPTTFLPTNGEHRIGQKPDSADWVYRIQAASSP